MTGSDRVEVEAGIKPSMFGGTLRRKKPPVARPPQEKKTEQEISGADVRYKIIIMAYIIIVRPVVYNYSAWCPICTQLKLSHEHFCWICRLNSRKF